MNSQVNSSNVVKAAALSAVILRECNLRQDCIQKLISRRSAHALPSSGDVNTSVSVDAQRGENATKDIFVHIIFDIQDTRVNLR